MTIKEFIGVFTTREISIMIWLIFIIIIVMYNNKTRKTLLNLLKILFGKQLRKVLIAIIAYVIGVTILFSFTPMWKNIYIKDVFIWLFSYGIFICMNSLSSKADDKYIILTLKDNLQIAMLLEFILSTFTFTFLMELLLIPFVTFMTILKTFSESSGEDKYVNKFIDFLFVALVLCILAGTIHVGMSEYRNLNVIDTLIIFFIPIIYLIAVIPMIFILELISKYQLLFISMSFNQVNDKKIRRSYKLKVLKECKCSIKKITLFQSNYIPKMYVGMSVKEFDSLIQKFRYEHKKTKISFCDLIKSKV